MNQKQSQLYLDLPWGWWTHGVWSLRCGGSRRVAWYRANVCCPHNYCQSIVGVSSRTCADLRHRKQRKFMVRTKYDCPSAKREHDCTRTGPIRVVRSRDAVSVALWRSSSRATNERRAHPDQFWLPRCITRTAASITGDYSLSFVMKFLENNDQNIK